MFIKIFFTLFKILLSKNIKNMSSNKLSNCKNVVILASGEGTNLQTLIDAINLKLIPINIKAVVSNNIDSKALVRAKINNIPTHFVYFDKNTQTREDYDKELIKIIKPYKTDLVLLLGYMRLVTSHLIDFFPHMLNIHPALPGQFPGSNPIEGAYQSFQKGLITESGVMVHRVIEEMDAGEVIDYISVPMISGENYEDFRLRIRKIEKPLLLCSIMKYINSLSLETHNSSKFIKTEKKNYISGKVRDRFSLGYNLMCFHHSDRLSAFDRHICHVPGKGELLNLINEWWMSRTQHIIPNHFIHSSGDYLIAKKCEVIPLEFIVRAYITGSTNTSLWTHYKNGVRNYCGIDFPDGLVKNQKLKEPVLTPTTKGEVDELISYNEILKRKIVNKTELDFIYRKSLELFEYGTEYLQEKGLILVDTKYEFGRDVDGNIILIDEIHTCDSSRFWLESTYEDCHSRRIEPSKLDKDAVRDYVKGICDPYNEPIPQIPEDKIRDVQECYSGYYELISGEKYNYSSHESINKINTNLDSNMVLKNYFQNIHSNVVVILSGSVRDEWFIDKLRTQFKKKDILCLEHISSAHKKTQEVLNILENYNSMSKFGRRIIYVTVAGRSNALSGVVACNTHYPVIACPPLQDKLDLQVNINSTLQMPSDVPVMTILEPINVAHCCQRMFNLCI